MGVVKIGQVVQVIDGVSHVDLEDVLGSEKIDVLVVPDHFDYVGMVHVVPQLPHELAGIEFCGVSEIKFLLEENDV